MLGEDYPRFYFKSICLYCTGECEAGTAYACMLNLMKKNALQLKPEQTINLLTLLRVCLSYNVTTSGHQCIRLLYHKDTHHKLMLKPAYQGRWLYLLLNT